MAVFCHLSFTFFLWILPLGESQHAVFDDKNWKQPLSCPQNTYRWPCAGFLKAGSGLERERGASPQRISKTIIAVVFFGWLSSFSKWDFWKLCCFGTIPYIVHMHGGWVPSSSYHHDLSPKESYLANSVLESWWCMIKFHGILFSSFSIEFLLCSCAQASHMGVLHNSHKCICWW
jgi:hypothetical protein